jgi:hypothetical protein
VIGFDEAVLSGNLLSPRLDGVCRYLDCQATGTTNEVVMVTPRRARSVEALSLLLQGIRLADSGKVRECAIDGREPYR